MSAKISELFVCTNEPFVLYGCSYQAKWRGSTAFHQQLLLLEGLQWMMVFTVYSFCYPNSTNHLFKKCNSFYELGL